MGLFARVPDPCSLFCFWFLFPLFFTYTFGIVDVEEVSPFQSMKEECTPRSRVRNQYQRNGRVGDFGLPAAQKSFLENQAEAKRIQMATNGHGGGGKFIPMFFLFIVINDTCNLEVKRECVLFTFILVLCFSTVYAIQELGKQYLVGNISQVVLHPKENSKVQRFLWTASHKRMLIEN